MPTRTGSRNVWITIYSPTKTRDAMGGQAETWAEIVTVKARKITSRSEESVRLQSTSGYAIHTFNIRYRSDITSKCKVVYNNKDMAIVGVPVDVDNKHRELDIKVKEVF